MNRHRGRGKLLMMWLVTFIATTGSLTVRGQDFNPRIEVNREFEAITEPDVVDATEAEEILADNELVIGLELDGEARAYPINMLTGPSREIINDRLGDRAIAATW